MANRTDPDAKSVHGTNPQVRRCLDRASSDLPLEMHALLILKCTGQWFTMSCSFTLGYALWDSHFQLLCLCPAEPD